MVLPTYFANYLTSESAEIHKSLFAVTEDEENPLSVVVAFRGSGKSTIMTMSLPNLGSTRQTAKEVRVNCQPNTVPSTSSPHEY